MKKTYKSSLLALSVLASFTSCSESESLQQANLSKDKITFHATLDNSWKPLSPASSSRAAIAAATEKGPIVVSTPFGKPLYLHPVVQDGIHIWSKEGKPITRSGAPLEDVEHERVALTRGTMSTKIGDYGSFGVTAIYKEGENNVLLLDNAEAEKTDGEFWGFTNNSNARWPIGSTVSFHAYAPHSSADKSMLTYEVDKENVQTQITYTASTTAADIINQPDLIVATNTGSRQPSDADDAVQLDFYHALTAVSFAIDKDLADVVGQGGKMTSVTLKGIPNNGKCQLSVSSATANVPTADWKIDNGTGEYTFDLSNANIVVGEKDQALTSDNRTLMMIPQTLPEGAELCFKLDMNGTTQEWKVPLNGQVWEAGKSIIYKLSSNSINMLDDAKIVYPNSWTAHSFPKTSFGENDVVGLYVVNKFNQIVAENVQLTKTKGEENSFTWKTKDNKNFSFSADNRYFAYYPYSASMTKGEGTATTATEFFKTKISSLANDDNVVADQSNEATLLAQDFQVAKGTVGPEAGSIVFNMEHQVGLAVINLKSKTLADTRQFTKDTYKYYYGEGEKPAAGDYQDLGTVDIVASNAFVGNKPYRADDAGKKYLQIIPIGRSLTYKASNQTESEIPTGWGKLTGMDFSLSPSANRSVVEKEFRPDYAREFYRLARLYTNNKYDQGQIDEFSTPEITQYKLECWGASSWGAEQTKYGGGYSYGKYAATEKNKILYVCAGGEGIQGGYNSNPNDFHVGGKGGYNGGGNAGNGNGYNGRYDQSGGGNGGGGATHIAFKTGLLTAFEKTYQDDVLLVAGGQGGATAYDFDALPIYSWGGGKTGAGVYAPFISDNNGINQGGQPVSEDSHNGAFFGRGQNGRNCINSPAPVYSGSRGGGGGGGGLWGGLSYQGTNQRSDCSGGGGCGYVNSTHLQNPSTIEGNQEFLSPSRTKESGHKGGGAAQISWLPSQLTRVK